MPVTGTEAAVAVIVYLICQHRAIALVLVDQLICYAGAFFVLICVKRYENRSNMYEKLKYDTKIR